MQEKIVILLDTFFCYPANGNVSKFVYARVLDIIYLKRVQEWRQNDTLTTHPP